MYEEEISLHDIEQPIMSCWQTSDDLKLLYENVSNQIISNEDISNALLGIIKLHDMRCEKLFSVYEDCLFKIGS